MRQGRYIVMGVCGCGKSTIGRAFADRLGINFLDGDDFHPRRNVEKMSRGEPLEDSDRMPWLAQVGAHLDAGTVIACSALKRSYRDSIRQIASGPVVFLYLRGSRETLTVRLQGRQGHFMPASLLESQFQVLQEPEADEGAVSVNIDATTDEIVGELLDKITIANTYGFRRSEAPPEHT